MDKLERQLLDELQLIHNKSLVDELKRVLISETETADNIKFKEIKSDILSDSIKITTEQFELTDDDRLSLSKLFDDVDSLKPIVCSESINDANTVEYKQALTFRGVRSTHPENPNVNDIYRNYSDECVYIYSDNKWQVFVKDGINAHSISGGGLGERDVVSLIKQYANTGDFTFNGSASAVSLDSSNFAVISADNLQDAMRYVDYKIATKILFGEYKTLNMDEEGDTIYVGSQTVSGDWYFKKVISDPLGNLTITYANNYSTSSTYNYAEAYTNKYILNYVTLNMLGL